MVQMNLLSKQKQTHRHRKEADSYQRENFGGGIRRYKILYIK